jgi:sugar phosphate permease
MEEKKAALGVEARESAIKRALSYRWVVWGIMVFAFMIVFFHRLAAAVVREDVTSAFSLSATAFGAMSSMYFYAYMAMQIPVGLLADTLGARITVSAGMFAAGAGSILFGFAPSYIWLLAGRFLVGLGVATVFACIMKIQSQWFRDREFATLSGAMALIGNSGGILSQGPLALLITIISWRSSFVGIGIMTLCVSFLCYVFIRNRPQDMGFPAINEREVLREGRRNEAFSISEGLRAVLSVKGVPAAACFYFFNQGGFFALLGTWGTAWLVNVYGMSVSKASSLMVMMVVGSMLGSIFTGWISDRIGRRKLPMIIAAAIHTLLWSVILFSMEKSLSIFSIKTVFFLLGVTNSSFVLAWTVGKELSSEKYTALTISVINTAGFLAIAILTSVMGMVIDFSADLPVATAYRRAFSLGLLSSIFSVIFAFLVPETSIFRQSKK